MMQFLQSLQISRYLRKLVLGGLGLGMACQIPSAAAQSDPSPSDALGQTHPSAVDNTVPQLVPLPAPVEQQPLQAMATEPSSRELQLAILDLLSELEPSRVPKLDRAKEELQAAIRELEQYLTTAADGGQAWSKFLQLEQLKAELQKDRPDAGLLADLQANMRQNYLGLEYQPYTRLRQAIADLVRALRYGYDPEKTVEILGTKLEQLFDSLNHPRSGADTERSYAVGLMANYLTETDQSPELIARLRRPFAVPNFQVYTTEGFVNRILTRTVAEPSPVNECILGTRVLGQACLTGAVSAELLPMPSGVALNLNMSATVNSQSRGYNRGVVLGSTASSPVFASKQIRVTEHGISTSPASVSANLNSQIHSIDHRLRIVRRIARKRAAEQKPLADAIAESRMQNRIRNQYDQQVEQQISQARSQLASFRGNPLPELARLGLSRPALQIHSTATAVNASLTQATAFQLSADRSCPLARPDSDIVIEVHQSAIANALDIVLSERTIRSFDLDDYSRQALGRVSEELEKEANGEAWSITLAAYRPVEIQWDDNLITIQLRITRLTRGDQMLNDPATVTAVYLPTYTRGGALRLDRQGEVDVNFPRASRGLRAVTLRSFLKGKFDTFFREEIVTEPLGLATRLAKAPGLDIDTLKLDDGWLQIGLK